MFNEILKTLRTNSNYKQEDVARYLGISRPAYTNYEIGKREPDFSTLTKLATYFEVSADYLLGETDNPTPPNKTALSNFEAAKKLQEELSKIDIDIEKEGELETILNFIDTNKEMLKKLMNKEWYEIKRN